MTAPTMVQTPDANYGVAKYRLTDGAEVARRHGWDKLGEVLADLAAMGDRHEDLRPALIAATGADRP